MTPAKAEVTDCREITELPVVINAVDTWCLKKNLSWNGTSGNAITVGRSSVTIDLNGFAITGTGGVNTQAVGVYSQNRRNVTIRNGTIRGFHNGVQLSTGSINHVLENLHIDQNRQTGVAIVGTGNILRNSQITNTGGTPGELDNNVAVTVGQANTTTIADNVISGTTANFGAYGISVSGSPLTEIRGNSILNTVGGETRLMGLLSIRMPPTRPFKTIVCSITRWAISQSLATAQRA